MVNIQKSKEGLIGQKGLQDCTLKPPKVTERNDGRQINQRYTMFMDQKTKYWHISLLYMDLQIELNLIENEFNLYIDINISL